MAVFVVAVLFPLQAIAQGLSDERAERFIRALLDGGDEVVDFVDAEALRTARRLGIRYEGVPHKFLIASDIDEPVKNGIREDGWRYTVAVRDLGEGFSCVLFSVPEREYEREFYFRGTGLVSPIMYAARNWHSVESARFKFFMSDTTLFNDYCMDNLERFIDTASSVLWFDDAALGKLAREKIYYFLCRDQEEIRLLTGFHARGMFIVAYDFVVTTFNAHYHELLHLLVNYKLGEAPLYTHPFLLEGFAVAFGGRGGKEPRVILDLGLFLYESEMVDHVALLTRKGFSAIDASISYPASGLYNLFLVQHLGIERYLDLYRRYSGTAEELDRMRIPESELPEGGAWHDFISAYRRDPVIDFTAPPAGARTIHTGDCVGVSTEGGRYYFSMKGRLLIGGGRSDGFRSRVYDEIIGDGAYRGEKYLIVAGETEISVYNLYTGNLAANFASSFSIPFETVRFSDGFYRFSVHTNAFDSALTEGTYFTCK